MKYLISGGEDGRGRTVIVIALDEDAAAAKYQKKYKEPCYTIKLNEYEYTELKKRHRQIEEIV